MVRQKIVRFTPIIDEANAWFIDGVEHYFCNAQTYKIQTYELHIAGRSMLGMKDGYGFCFVEGETLW